MIRAAARNSGRTARAHSTWRPVLAFIVLALGVSRVQPRLARELHTIKDSDDVYPFPPPPVLRLATLGYVAAMTDVLWAKLLIEHGSHWGEHRPFLNLEHYLDAIVELDPTFLPFYDYVDTLLCYRPMNGHEADAREARAYLERGLRALPDDAHVWLHYGQFVAFMGPGYLADKSDQQAWRKDGALAIQHAVDLGADVDYGIAASAVLSDRFGERDVAARFLERAYALTDDEMERREIAARLEIMHKNETVDRARTVVQAVEARWQAEYPFLDRGTYMLAGPKVDPVHCAGPASAHDPACARDWDDALRHELTR